MAKAFIGVVTMGLGACAAAPESGGSAPAAPARPAATPAATPAASSASLNGTRWKGVIDPSLNQAATPWLEFAEGRVSGFSGCNLLNGAWRNEGGQVRLGPLVMTKRGCMGAEGEVEKRLMAVLNEQSRVSREGNRLILAGPAGERFEFVLAPS